MRAAYPAALPATTSHGPKPHTIASRHDFLRTGFVEPEIGIEPLTCALRDQARTFDQEPT